MRKWSHHGSWGAQGAAAPVRLRDMNTSRIENPEIIAKLMNPDPELDDIEWVQALYTARQQTNTWIEAEHAVINGLLSERTYREIFDDIDIIVKEMPGLIPAFEYIFEAYKVDENSDLETVAYLVKAVRSSRKERSRVDQFVESEQTFAGRKKKVSDEPEQLTAFPGILTRI